MANKPGKKKSKPLARKQMKKTKGGLGDGSVRFTIDPLPAAGHVKVFSGKDGSL